LPSEELEIEMLVRLAPGVLGRVEDAIFRRAWDVANANAIVVGEILGLGHHAVLSRAERLGLEKRRRGTPPKHERIALFERGIALPGPPRRPRKKGAGK
jgi:hypothetical protein